MVDCVVVFEYQIAYKHKLIAIVLKAFKNCGQSLRGVVGVVVEQYYRPGTDLGCYSLANAVRRGAVLPVEAIPVRSSWKTRIIYSSKNLNKSKVRPHIIVLRGGSYDNNKYIQVAKY